MSKRKTRAVVTMVRNESVFLPIWWHYYSQFFAYDDMYILDHESSDGSTSGPCFIRIPVSHPKVDWGWHRDKLQNLQHELVKKYDVVLCTDVDEIVAPDPRHGNLGDYIDCFESDFVNCRGYEVLHIKNIENSIDLSQPVLAQRSYWYFNPAYSKPLLARVPMFWHGGLHQRTDGLTSDDPSLYLIHLHRMDYELCRNRHRQRLQLPWNQRDVEEGWGYQNRIEEELHFEKWFYQDSCSNTPIRIEKIPYHWKKIV